MAGQYDYLPELVSQAQFAHALTWAVALWCAAWLVAGAILLLLRRAGALWCAYALLCGGVVWGGWQAFSLVTKADPATGRAGLHRVSVMLFCLALSLALGGALGVLAAAVGRLARRLGGGKPSSR